MKPAAIRRDIAKKTRVAVSIAQPQFYNIMQSIVQRYYSEYTPKRYLRTYNLYNSLDLSGVRSVGLGATGAIYFDPSRMSYATGKVMLKQKDGDTSLKYGYATWGAGQVLDSAMSGSHGGYIGGTPIWPESIATLTPMANSILIGSCAAAGL